MFANFITNLLTIVDSLIFQYYKKQYGEPVFAKIHKAKALLRKALNKAINNEILPAKNASERRAKQQSLQRLGIDYLLEEIETVILDRGLVILEDYLAVSRRGRGTPLNQNLREAIWLLYLNNTGVRKPCIFKSGMKHDTSGFIRREY